MQHLISTKDWSCVWEAGSKFGGNTIWNELKQVSSSTASLKTAQLDLRIRFLRI